MNQVRMSKSGISKMGISKIRISKYKIIVALLTALLIIFLAEFMVSHAQPVGGCEPGHTQNLDGSCTAVFYPYVNLSGHLSSFGYLNWRQSWDELRDSQTAGMFSADSYNSLRAHNHYTPAYYQDDKLLRTVVSFRIYDIPSNAIVQAANITLTPSYLGAVMPSDYYEDYVTLVDVSLNNPPSISRGDFRNFGQEIIETYDRFEIDAGHINDPHTFHLNTLGLIKISPDSWANFGLMLGPDIEGIEPGYENDYVYLDAEFYLSNVGFGSPELVVKYLPAGVGECGDGIVYGDEECDDSNIIGGDGCSANCLIELDPVYVGLYMGDIDGSYSEDWYFFYEYLSDYFHDNEINVGISFFPGTIDDHPTFERAIENMYLSEYIELIQKGYLGNDLEKMMDQLHYEVQRQIILNGQEAFNESMEQITGTSDIQPPTTYNQIHGRFTNTTKAASQTLGFKVYFDLFLEPDLDPVLSDDEYDVTQYGISFTTYGDVGRDTFFRSKRQIIELIRDFDDNGPIIVHINGIPVIPIWAHHQDFEDKIVDNTIDLNKWDIYSSTIARLKEDPNVMLITPTQMYELRHNSSGNNTNQTNETNSTNMTRICQFATDATATNENSAGSLAVYATGNPDATYSGDCGSWSGYGYTWSPENWDIKANLTLTYETPVLAGNFTIHGDYDMCWDRAWLKNSMTGDEILVWTGLDSTCVLTVNLDESFLADTLILETCGWSWSSTDAVEMCGAVDETNVSIPDVSICKWKHCEKGAVSVSVDDYYTSCMIELESHGYRGTYFLSNTDSFTPLLWDVFNDGFNNGHELGTHTLNHNCQPIPDQQYIDEIDDNIADIVSNTNATRNDIISHGHPCGFFTPSQKDLLKSNWKFLSARGYNHNQLEEQTPSDFFDMKSYNSHGYPGGALQPGDYFEAVDNAVEDEKWLNLVFHVECDDDEVIDYLPSKSVWVDTIGNVVKYIKLRDESSIINLIKTPSLINFRVVSGLNYYEKYLEEVSYLESDKGEGSSDSRESEGEIRASAPSNRDSASANRRPYPDINIYEQEPHSVVYCPFCDQNLSIRVVVDQMPSRVKVNGYFVDFDYYQTLGDDYVVFDVKMRSIYQYYHYYYRSASVLIQY